MFRVSKEAAKKVSNELGKKKLETIFKEMKKENPYIAEYIQRQFKKPNPELSEILGTGIVVYLLLKAEWDIRENSDIDKNFMDFLGNINTEDLFDDLDN